MANSWHKFTIFLIFCFSFAGLLSGCGDIEAELSSLVISPPSATVGVNQSQAFTVVGKDSLGMIVQVNPTWSVEGAIGTITANGLFKARSSTGEGYVAASYSGKSSRARVTVTDKCWVAGRVRGERDTSGAENILVYLGGTALSKRTDSTGNYSISNVPAGTYDVYAQDDRANPIYQTGTYEGQAVSSGETITVDFFLTVLPGIPDIPTTTIPVF
jgi:hypothetical protein